MITKEKLQEHIAKFPDKISIDELIEKLLFIDKLEKRIALSESNSSVSEDELEKEINKWK